MDKLWKCDKYRQFGDVLQMCRRSGRAWRHVMNLMAAGILTLFLAGTVAAEQTSGCAGGCTGSCTAEARPHLIPADKNLSSAWIRSLYERGQPEVLTGVELKYIGMPIGGIGCGQLYLGGDGRLWLWDIFKSNYRREPDHGQRIAAFTLGGHYAHPVASGEQYTQWNGAQVAQGFLIRTRVDGRTITRTLDKRGFPGVSFRGEYPIGKAIYRDRDLPVTVALEAFSPFIPLNVKDSALPATVMSYTVTNSSSSAVTVDLGSWMQNATCPYTTDPTLGRRVNRVIREKDRVSVYSTIEPAPGPSDSPARPVIVFADFEGDDWGDWIAEGDAFAGGPFPGNRFVPHQKVSGFSGSKLANSFNTRMAPEPGQTDKLTGILTSRKFKIDRNFIVLSVCGGGNAEQVYVEAVIDGESVGRVTGHNSIVMTEKCIDLASYQGKSAQLRIVDSARGGWGHITVDRIVLTDRKPDEIGITGKHGYGSMSLTLLHDSEDMTVSAAQTLDDPNCPEGLFSQMKTLDTAAAGKPLDELLVGGLTASFGLAPGQSRTIDFLITWYFPYHNEIDAAPGQLLRVKDFRRLSRHYRPWFDSADEVAGYVAAHKQRLLGDTRLWNQTWYDSSLPYWFLDRSFIAIDCLASQMFHWFDNGRPYAWEGVDCCPGTCTHVWHYAQGLSRVFPALERAFRERVDFRAGVGFDAETGLISDRGDFHEHEATDGQAGTILRVYREHLMSKDDAFLRRLWPNIKKSVQFLMAKDPQGKGLLEGRQPHTLDAAWFGPMGWISGLYLGALTAGEAMAEEMGDADFARQCRTLIDRGKQNIVAELFNGEYFIHKPDPQHRAIQSGPGCHIDQVLGQAWMHQVGLDRVIPKTETVSALNSLWKYNFAPDAGAYAMEHREIEKAFRWYAMPGEAGLLMCTWPRGGAKDAIPGDQLRPEKNPEVWTGPGGYFNECMNGFEYQAAWHMIAEGKPGSALVRQGLAIMKTIHERYAAAQRNPYNEIECSDHYARSMASYGIYLAACGYNYHGPRGHIGFAPRLQPEDFRAAFTAAEGWGTFTQKRTAARQTDTIELSWGQMRLTELAFEIPQSDPVKEVTVLLAGTSLASTYHQEGQQIVIQLPIEALLLKRSKLTVEIAL